MLLPTDTVYGVAADAFTPAAVTGLLAAKNRGRTMPVPVLIGEASTLAGLVVNLPPVAHQLAEAFWPGGLTLVLEHAPSLAWDLGDAEGTVAVRLPDDEVARDLLRRTGPLAVSSANRSGRPAASTAQEATDQLGTHAPSSWTAARGPARRRARSSTARVRCLVCCASERSASPVSARSRRSSRTDDWGTAPSGRVGPEGSRAGTKQRLNATGERHVAAVQSGGLPCLSDTVGRPPRRPSPGQAGARNDSSGVHPR